LSPFAKHFLVLQSNNAVLEFAMKVYGERSPRTLVNV